MPTSERVARKCPLLLGMQQLDGARRTAVIFGFAGLAMAILLASWRLHALVRPCAAPRSKEKATSVLMKMRYV